MNATSTRTIENRTERSNRPSTAVVLVLGIAVVAFVLALSIAPSPAVDLFWQMRTGRLIASTHAVPHVDTFSWTRYGHPWIVHEWAMCLLLWAAYHVDGFCGVYILEAFLLIAVFLLLYTLMLRETKFAPITSACLAIWAAKLSSPLISPRPHLFTYLFLIVFVGLILAVRRNPERRRFLWALPPLSAVWANFHGGVIVGVGIVAVFGVCDWIESKGGSLAKFELLIAGCSTLALLLNPYGVRIFDIFAQTVGNPTMPRFVSEWSALDFHNSLGRLFEALAGLIIAGLALTRERRSAAEIVIVVLFAHASLTASRNVPLFALAALLVTGRHIQSALDRVFSKDGGRSDLFGSNPSAIVASTVALVVVAQSTLFAREQMRRAHVDGGTLLQRSAAASFDLHYFPRNAARFLTTENFPHDWRLYNDYNLGSYIGWVAPDRKISIDTQTDVFFGRVLDDYARMDDLPFDWRKILDRYRPDIAFFSADEPQSRLFAASPDWALVWADSPGALDDGAANALIFVRNVPTNAALIDRCRHDCPTLRAHPEMTSTPLLTGGDR